MERIFDKTQTITANEFILVHFKKTSKGDCDFVGAIAYCELNGRYFLFSNSNRFRGGFADNSTFSALPCRFNYSWRALSSSDDLNLCEVLSNFDDATFHIWDVYHGPIEDLHPRVVDFINPKYEVANIYRAQSGYHSHSYSELNRPIKSFRGHRIGVELEVEFNNEDLKDDFGIVESNWFYKERDSSLNDEGMEIITIPLLPEDAKSVEFWRPLTDELHDKTTSWDSGRCGLHVHIGREILGVTEDERQLTIGKLLLVYHEFIKDTYLNRKIYGRERGYHDNDGKTSLSSAVKELGVRILQDTEVAKKVQQSVVDRSSCDRYFDINITPRNTIEFRKGRGSINPERIAMVVEYSEMLCKYAKQAVWQQLSYENFIHFLKANCKKGTSLYDMVMSYA